MNQAITIETSKTKTIFCLLGSLCFVIVGFVLLFDADVMFPTKPTRILFAQVSGFLGIITFGFFSLAIIKCLFSKHQQLIIDNTGITIFNFGLVEWQDIIRIDTLIIHRNKLLLIYLNNEQKYLHKLSKFQRFVAKMNIKYYGTPLSISSTPYQCNFKQLEQYLSQGLSDYQQSSTQLTSPTNNGSVNHG